ncbi:hypothetical protein HYALB_00000661 [Hymenoscyphus albidus]|uniref:Zn(2)-C6 fungal-type domain-containing protein n=1 Tax=Hymenoscyphus albidus TaxID=595503 RepID=A0A9N9QDG0_9HELO|nr:hypothetical protein HYALB_00000661 [Hymenoscyphus albidus]
MVQVHRSYYDDEEPGLRRYNRHTGHGYAIGHERELPHGPYEGHAGRDHLSAAHHDSRGGSRAPEPDNTRPRSRIPVACGRCRKRKIRCSGDTGSGQPCTNCKNAGNEHCQFLRVSSQGMQMKNESVDFSAFDTHSHSRLQPRVASSYGSHAATYISPSAQVPEGYYAGRASVSGYQYPASRYYGLATFNDYSEDNGIDYDTHNASNPYQLMGSDHHLLSTSLPTGSGRGWPTQATQPTQVIKPDPSLYLEHSSYTTNGHIPSQGAYQLRPQMASDVKDTPLAGSSIHSMSVPDRVLPVPATTSSAASVNRPPAVASQTNSSSYARANSTATSSVPPSQNSWHQYDGLMAAQVLSTVKNLPQNDSNYIYTSSPESLNSSQATFHSSQSLSNSSQNELYTTSSADMFHGNESTEPSYGPSSNSSQRHNANCSEGSMSNINSNLVNGQPYVPHYSQAPYPIPPTQFTQNESRMRTKLPSAPVGISA